MRCAYHRETTPSDGKMVKGISPAVHYLRYAGVHSRHHVDRGLLRPRNYARLVVKWRFVGRCSVFINNRTMGHGESSVRVGFKHADAPLYKSGIRASSEQRMQKYLPSTHGAVRHVAGRTEVFAIADNRHQSRIFTCIFDGNIPGLVSRSVV